MRPQSTHPRAVPGTRRWKSRVDRHGSRGGSVARWGPWLLVLGMAAYTGSFVRNHFTEMQASVSSRISGDATSFLLNDNGDGVHVEDVGSRCDIEYDRDLAVPHKAAHVDFPSGSYAVTLDDPHHSPHNQCCDLCIARTEYPSCMLAVYDRNVTCWLITHYNGTLREDPRRSVLYPMKGDAEGQSDKGRR